MRKPRLNPRPKKRIPLYRSVSCDYPCCEFSGRWIVEFECSAEMIEERWRLKRADVHASGFVRMWLKRKYKITGELLEPGFSYGEADPYTTMLKLEWGGINRWFASEEPLIEQNKPYPTNLITMPQ